MAPHTLGEGIHCDLLPYFFLCIRTRLLGLRPAKWTFYRFAGMVS
jgi:hypothetical protein